MGAQSDLVRRQYAGATHAAEWLQAHEGKEVFAAGLPAPQRITKR